ncbi:MAG TPA: hypothetical protein VI282_11870 [Verrucomicrobiae bacterium]|jgi:hypothetical protein
MKGFIKIAAALATTAILNVSNNAINIVTVTDTPTELYFTFTGKGIADFQPKVSSSYWQSGTMSPGEGAQTFDWAGEYKHLGSPDGPFLFTFVFGDYGTTQTASDNATHGAGTDAMEVSLNVQGDPTPFAGTFTWGDFSGSIHLFHREASLPDGGATATFLIAGLAALSIALRKK